MGFAKAALPHDAWRLFEAGVPGGDGSLDGYLERILTQCVDWFAATGASVFLRHAATDRFKLAAQAGSDSRIPKSAIIHAGSGIAGLSIERGEPLLITDPLSHPLLQGRVNTHHVSLGSSIVMPLIAREEGCIGVLNLSRSTEERPFDSSDVHKVAALALQISLAISNARLLSRLEDARKAESAARQKLEGVVQSLGVAVFVYDLNGVLTDSNERARELMVEGGDRWSNLPHLGKGLDVALQGPGRIKTVDPDRDRSWSIVATALKGGGTTAVVEETTEHDQRQQEMARLARLAEIGQMTAAIAHEIRNPLTGIRSAAQMIAQAPEHAAEFAEIIEEEVLKLNEICEEFLEFSRPLTLHKRSVDLAALAKRVLQNHRDQFEARDVVLELEIADEKPIIYGDALRIEQILRNLILNALQACESGGRVRLELRTGGFAVADTGHGMGEEALQKLFTPFFTTKANGTGLGLCNVRKIVDAHGGTLKVASEPESGARFDVLLGEAP